MLAAKLLVTLFALPFALAQDASGDAQPSDASTDTGAGGGGGGDPAATTDAGSQTGGGQAQTTKKPSVGGVTDNTGHGASANETGNWNLTQFSMPTNDLYWVDGIENTASWTPYTEPVNLIIFNSNQSILNGERKQIAENIAGGQGSWTGKIEGYPPANNYILVLALTSNPDRKIAQTRGFWIKRNGTLPVQTGSVQAATSGQSGASGASGTATGAGANKSAPAAGESGSGSGSGSGAGALVVSLGSVLAAGALALTVF